MRVIETIVTTVPRNEVHSDAEFFAQDWDDGLIGQWSKEPFTVDEGWEGSGYKGCLGYPSISEDASTAIITREELMKAYDLVERGYELWFGGDCPVEKGTLADVIYRNWDENLHVEAGVSPCNTGSIPKKNASDWGSYGFSNDNIAYRLSEAEDKSSNLVPLSEEKIKVIQANIKYKGHRDWSAASFNSVSIDPESGIRVDLGNNLVIITKDEWNAYSDSIKIEVGDTVSFVHSDVFYEVLYVGKEKAFIKDSDGTEYSFPLEELSKVAK